MLLVANSGPKSLLMTSRYCKHYAVDALMLGHSLLPNGQVFNLQYSLGVRYGAVGKQQLV